MSTKRKRNLPNRVKYLDRATTISPFYLLLATTQEQFHRELKRLGVPVSAWEEFPNPKDNGTNAHICFFKESDGAKQIALMCLPEQLKRRYSKAHIAGIVAHEVMHIWRKIRQYIGEEDPSREFEAYSVQNLVTTFLDAYYGK